MTRVSICPDSLFFTHCPADARGLRNLPTGKRTVVSEAVQLLQSKPCYRHRTACMAGANKGCRHHPPKWSRKIKHSARRWHCSSSADTQGFLWQFGGSKHRLPSLQGGRLRSSSHMPRAPYLRQSRRCSGLFLPLFVPDHLGKLGAKAGSWLTASWNLESGPAARPQSP